MKEKNYTDILKDCVKIADIRQAQYGMTGPCFKLAKDILDIAFGIKLTTPEIAKVFVAMKLAREKFDHKDDNILDTVNYLCISLNEREEKLK